ncbi:hypothetical protein [Actinoplanes sp. ATCC 53533]|uniref:hypothetical protein n=1 Tax=Actinoplanes sp. ATCC 53533 TaxID=1288362 RepID=UPI000F79D370|nr:hypothetical protein [Actinoplanes sp. ATCC 53533]
MRHTSRPLMALATATMIVTGGVLVGAAPAYADTSCTPKQKKSFATPGYNTDLEVQVCVANSGPHRSAHIQVGWQDGGSSSTDGDRKFDKLVLHYRLERNDRDYATGSCSIAGRVNTNRSGAWVCGTTEVTSSLTGGWSGDGYVQYDLDRDGEGSSNWQLTGSPLVR